MAAQTLPKTSALTRRKSNAFTQPKTNALSQSKTHDFNKIPLEGEDDLELDLGFDPTSPSLESTATAGHPFALPWSREVRAILAGLDSDRLKDPAGPWVLESPFDLRLAQLIAVIPDSIRDGTNGLSTAGHYRDGLSTTSESSKEHFSASLGVTIGYPFLNASVSAKYDRQVAEDKNVCLHLNPVFSTSGEDYENSLLTTLTGHQSLAQCLVPSRSGHSRPNPGALPGRPEHTAVRRRVRKAIPTAVR